MPISRGNDIWNGGDPTQARAAVYSFYLLLAVHIGKLLAWIGLCVAFALAYGSISRPEFIAVSQVLLEPRVVAQDGPEVVRAFNKIELDSEQALTEQLTIQSPRVLRYAFDELHLVGSPELAPENDGYFTQMLRRWHAILGKGDGLEADRQFARFAARVRSRQLASSYNIDITYEAQSAQQAARVANSVASAYLRDRLVQVAGVALGGSAYHVTQVATLRAEIAAAEIAVAAGTVPASVLPDANVRLLGRAVPPLRPVFPRWPPLVALAIIFGAVTAALAAAALRDAGQRVRTGRQIVDRVGVECLVVGGVDLRPALRCIWARVAARVVAERRMTIGFAAWESGPGALALAAGLAAMMDRAGLRAQQVPPTGAEGDATFLPPGSDGSWVLVTVLPPLARWHDTCVALTALDAVFFVVEADYTSIADARAGVRLMRKLGDAFAGVILAPAAEF